MLDDLTYENTPPDTILAKLKEELPRWSWEKVVTHGGKAIRFDGGCGLMRASVDIEHLRWVMRVWRFDCSAAVGGAVLRAKCCGSFKETMRQIRLLAGDVNGLMVV